MNFIENLYLDDFVELFNVLIKRKNEEREEKIMNFLLQKWCSEIFLMEKPITFKEYYDAYQNSNKKHNSPEEEAEKMKKKEVDKDALMRELEEIARLDLERINKSKEEAETDESI